MELTDNMIICKSLFVYQRRLLELYFELKNNSEGTDLDISIDEVDALLDRVGKLLDDWTEKLKNECLWEKENEINRRG